METTLTAIASSLGGMLALLTGQRMWARRNGRPDYYGTGPTFQEAARVAVALWERFEPGLPPQGCNSRADLEATQ